MRRITSIATTLIAAIGVVAPVCADGTPQLAGKYVLDATASDNIETVIETATAPMNFVYRMGARAVLKKRHTAYAKLQIAHDAQEIVVTLADGNPMRMPIDGTTAKWTREDGDVLVIKGQLQGQALTQTLWTSDTKRINDFSLDTTGGTLTLKVQFTSQQLEKPMLYQLVYRRDAL